jgi:hypothetical protein
MSAIDPPSMGRFQLATVMIRKPSAHLERRLALHNDHSDDVERTVS